MKRFLFAIVVLASFLAAAPKADARTNVSINFFYNHLDDGYWLDVAGYGYCWQPHIAVRSRGWRPYADGYWAFTNVGWTWVSYEPFGWATYHYGRWARIRGYGWVWVPGYEWGPAWVSWRVGRNYVGWAPLPPRPYTSTGWEPIYYGRPISGYVDLDFDIGPAYYNFVDVRYMGAPVLSRHIFAPTRNVTYIQQTVNVTNITYQNNVVHNYGPDYNRLNAYSTRPIQRLTLERATDVPPERAAAEGGFTRVRGDRLVVAAPPVLEKPAEPIAPPTVKTRVRDVNLERGWSEIRDEKARAKIVERMKKEDRRSIPPPEIPPVNPDALTAEPPAPEPAVTPEIGDPAISAPAAPRERGRGRDRAEQPTGEPAATPEQKPPAVREPGQRGRGRQQVRQPAIEDRADVQEQVTTPEAAVPPQVREPQEVREPRGRGRGQRGQQPQIPEFSPPAPVEQPQPERRQQPRREVPAPEIDRDVFTPPPQPEPQEQPQRGNRGRGRGNDRPETAPAVQPPPQMPDVQRELLRQPRQPQIQPVPPQPPPQQVAPQEAAPQQERERGRGRGRGDRPDKGERGEQEE